MKLCARLLAVLGLLSAGTPETTDQQFSDDWITVSYPGAWRATRTEGGVRLLDATGVRRLDIVRIPLDRRIEPELAHREDVRRFTVSQPGEWVVVAPELPRRYADRASRVVTHFVSRRETGRAATVLTICCKGGSSLVAQFFYPGRVEPQLFLLERIASSIRLNAAKLVPGRFAQHNRLTLLSDSSAVYEWLEEGKWRSQTGLWAIDGDSITLRLGSLPEVCRYDVWPNSLELTCGTRGAFTLSREGF